MEKPSVTATLLAIIDEQVKARGPVFDDGTVLMEANKRLDARDIETQHAILDAWHDLYRTGLITWGLNLTSQSNWSAPWAHLTVLGRRAIADVSRDPSNPAGYLAALDPFLPASTVPRSYIEEAVRTYRSGCDKATAVMVGAAAEALIIDLRDALVSRMAALGKTVPKKLEDWRIKTVTDALELELVAVKAQIPRELFERFDAFWSALCGQLRIARNDVGHPKSVDPVTRETVHSLLLLFPEQARLAVDLLKWVGTSYA